MDCFKEKLAIKVALLRCKIWLQKQQRKKYFEGVTHTQLTNQGGSPGTHPIEILQHKFTLRYFSSILIGCSKFSTNQNA